MSTEGEDFDLLREYVANQSETAFLTLVEETRNREETKGTKTTKKA